MPAATTYESCWNQSGPYSGPCGNSGGLVTWTVGSVGAGTTGTVCFGAVVSGYPWWPPDGDVEFALRRRGAFLTQQAGVYVWRQEECAF